MDIEQVRNYCLSRPLATEDCAFGPDGVLFRVYNKIFAYIDLTTADRVVLKCDPDRAIALRDEYAGIEGAWHWNKRYWNAVKLEEDVPEAVVLELIDHSLAEVIAKLPGGYKPNMPHFSLDLPKDWHYLHLDTTDSTMTRLAETEDRGETVLLTTDYQTAGRGQTGNTWEAEAGRNLLFGLRFHPAELAAGSQFLLSEALALAVSEGVRQATGVRTEVKWPNDIYYGERKLCGILLTHTLAGSKIKTTVLGAGVNVNQTLFRSDAPNPVSLRQIVGEAVSREALLQAVLDVFRRNIRLVERGEAAALHREYLNNLYRRTGLHPYRDRNGRFEARTIDVSPEGLLTLERPDGTRNDYAFKEIAFLRS